MEMKKLLLKIIIMLAFLFTACGSTPDVDWEISIKGGGIRPQSFTFVELSEFDHTSLDGILMEKSIGEDEYGSWSGVALLDLLSAAGADTDYATISAIASDGYTVEISKAELQGSIIALKHNGEWIHKSDPEHGPVRLVCPQTPANRWVYQLTELSINK